MGIYDREYYQRESGSGGFAAMNRVCRSLIIVNVIVFVIQLATRLNNQTIAGPVTSALELDVSRVMHGEIWRLLTYAFLHSEAWQHIVFNMLFLWWFGRALEDEYGGKEFLAFYLVSALVGGLAYVGFELLQGANRPCIGASGAVTAVLVLFAMHYPNAKVLFLFFIPMRVIVLVTIFVVLDILGMMGHGREGIAFVVHLGGAAFGYLYYKFNWRIMNWWPSRMSMRPRRSRPRLRVFRDDEDTALSEPEQVFDAEVDRVLEKVQRHGKASLTEHENQVLLKASEVYKHRRK